MTVTRLSINITSSAFKAAARNTSNRQVNQWLSSSRQFSTTSSIGRDGPWSDPIVKPLNRYVIIAEDYPGPSALARRLEVRDRHLEQAARGKEAGRIELGGGLLKRDFADIDEELGPTSALAGSLLVVQGESIAEVRSRFNQDEYVQAGVFDPSKIRIFPFLQSFNVKSMEVGHASVGETKPISTRRPKGESSVKTSNRRSEVYVKDPRASGKSINTGDQKVSENTLGHLRNSQSRKQQHHTVTLDTLRKTPAMPRSEESQ